MINPSIYYLAQLLTPTFLRLPKISAFIEVAVIGVQSLKIRQWAFFKKIEHQLTFNGTVIMLEHFLNDVYDPGLRRIKIEDLDLIEPLYLFNKSEQNEQTYLFNSAEGNPVFLRNQSESNSERFKIIIPASVVFNEQNLRARLKRYVLPTMKYLVEVI